MPVLILAVGDFHGTISWLPEKLDEWRPDLLLCAGDWGDPGQVPEPVYQQVLEKAYTLSIWGNHDDRGLLETLHNRDGSPVLLAQGELRRVDELVIMGISGIWAKTKLGSRLTPRWEAALRRDPSLTLEQWLAGKLPPPYITDAEVASMAAGVSEERVDILMTHGCPVGLADRTPRGDRGGNRCFRTAVETIRPRLHLCGHLHVQQRDDLEDGRTVINCGSGAEGDGWLIRWETAGWHAEPLAPGRQTGP